MNAAHVLQKASKYAGREDDRLLDGIEAHPNADGAIARLNDDVGGRLAGSVDPGEEPERWDGLS